MDAMRTTPSPPGFIGVVSASQWHVVSAVTLAVCWGSFALVWAVGALYNARHGPAALRRSGPPYAWMVVAVAVWLVFRAVPGGGWNSLTLGTSWVRAPGLIILVVATAFTLWARVVLGTMWSSLVVEKEHHQLRTDGPYAITRHPIYTGMVGMLLGTALLAGLGPWAVVLAVGILLVEIKLHAEERLLVEVFGGQYERYRREVPQLVPGLRRPGTR